MVSRRARSKNTIGTRLDSLDSRVKQTEKKSTTPRSDDVALGTIQENAVTSREIATNAVGPDQIAPGAIGTENLGVINKVASDSSMDLEAPGEVTVNGIPIADTTDVAAGDAAVVVSMGLAARNRNKIDNGNGRTNQRGYLTGVGLKAGEYGLDRWQCAGITNLDTNPRFEATTTSWNAYNGSTQAKSSAQAHSATNSMLVTRTAATDDYVGKTFSGLTVGKFYTASAWVRKTATGASYTSRGLFIDTGLGTAYSVTTNTWERISVTFIATLTSHQIRFYAITSASLYVDDFMLTLGSTLWPFHSGASSDSVWNGTADASTSTRGPASGPSVSNLFINPSVETNTTGWGSNHANLIVSRVTTGHDIPGIATEGTAFLRITANAAVGLDTGMVPSAYTTLLYGDSVASVWVRSSKIQRVRPRIELSGGTSSTIQGSDVVLAANTWTRLSVSVNVTNTTTNLRLYVYTITGTSSSSWANNDTMDFDCMLVTSGADLYNYFDGDTTDTTLKDYGWVGTAHASISTLSAVTRLDFTSTPQGQTVSMQATAGDMGVMQVLERANVHAAQHVMSWTGTATGRAYNVGTDPASLPAFAASGMTVTFDALDDVVIEFRAVGGTKTLGLIQLELGAVATPFERIPVADELRLCQRHFYTIPLQGLTVHNPYWNAALSGGSLLVGKTHPVAMRIAPLFLSPSGSSAHTFTMKNYSAGADGDYIFGPVAPIVGDVQGITTAGYNSSDNGGGSLPVGRVSGWNKFAIQVSADF